MLLKRLIYKEASYARLFQCAIDFLFQCSYNNASIQRFLMHEMNMFLYLFTKGLDTSSLITEMIKVNTDPEKNTALVAYICKVVTEIDTFTSTHIKMLSRLARINTLLPYAPGVYPDRAPEHPNQSFIIRQLIPNLRFRHLLYMRKGIGEMKLKMIQEYAMKREQYNLS